MNPITRVAVLAAAVVVAAGVAFFALSPVSDVGPPATASPALPSIEGTWDVSYTHQEMLDAGIADQSEDNLGNYGHFRLTFQAGRWKADQLSPTTFNGGVSTYSVDGGIAHLYSPDDDTTFDIPYTVTATTLTFGQGGPVMFRVKPWTRVALEPVPTEVPGSPIKAGIYKGPTFQVADLIASINADPGLTAQERTQLIDVLFAIKDKATWSASFEFRAGRYTERQTIDGVTDIGSRGTYAFPDDHSIDLLESGSATASRYSLVVNGDGFTLDAVAPPSAALDAFIVRTLFEQTFTFVR